MSKYRIRQFSPIWWASRIAAGVSAVAGVYAWYCVLWMVSL